MNSGKIKYVYLLIISIFGLLAFYISIKLLFFDLERKEIFLRYLIFSILIILYFFLYFILNQNLKKYFSIIFYSTILFLLIAESTIFFLNSEQKKNNKTLLSLYNEIKTSDLYLNFFPSGQIFNNNDYFILSGLSNKKILTCIELDEYQIIMTDRYGFNNEDKEWDKKIPKYVFIGDSFVHGHCVKNEYNLISSFYENEKLLGNDAIINLGKGGAGPLTTLATLIEYLPDNTENLIYVFNEGNDLRNILDETNNTILMKYLKDRNFKQNLKEKQKFIDKIILKDQKKVNIEYRTKKNKMNYINILYFNNLKRIVINNLIKMNYNFQIFEKFLNELTYLTFKKKIKNVYFVYLPSQERIIKKNYFFKRKYNKVLNLLDNYNFKLIDLTNHLLKLSETKNPWMTFNGHFDKESYSSVSSEIFKQLGN